MPVIKGRIIGGVKYDYALSDDQLNALFGMFKTINGQSLRRTDGDENISIEASTGGNSGNSGTPSTPGAGLTAHEAFKLSHVDITDSGNVQLDATHDYMYKAVADNVAKTYENRNGSVFAKKGDLVTYEMINTGTEAEIAAKKAYYEAEVAKYKFVSNVDNAPMYNTANVAAAKAEIDAASLSPEAIAFYSDTTKTYFTAAVATKYANGTNAAKKAVVFASACSSSDLAYYRAMCEAGDWSEKTIWKIKNLTWELDNANINLDTNAKIKLRGKSVEILDEADVHNTRMESVSINAETIKLNAGAISIKNNVTQNAEMKGNDITFIYDFTNNLIDSSVSESQAVANYKAKYCPEGAWNETVPGYKTDDEIKAEYQRLKSLPRNRHIANISQIIKAGEDIDKKITAPAGGTNGQMLVKAADGYAWANAPVFDLEKGLMIVGGKRFTLTAAPTPNFIYGKVACDDIYGFANASDIANKVAELYPVADTTEVSDITSQTDITIDGDGIAFILVKDGVDKTFGFIDGVGATNAFVNGNSQANGVDCVIAGETYKLFAMTSSNETIKFIPMA